MAFFVLVNLASGGNARGHGHLRFVLSAFLASTGASALVSVILGGYWLGLDLGRFGGDILLAGLLFGQLFLAEVGQLIDLFWLILLRGKAVH